PPKGTPNLQGVACTEHRDHACIKKERRFLNQRIFLVGSVERDSTALSCGIQGTWIRRGTPIPDFEERFVSDQATIEIARPLAFRSPFYGAGELRTNSVRYHGYVVESTLDGY